MRILTLDIETAPNIAHVWGLWQNNVSLNQLMQSSYILCWAAKWYGEDKVYFASTFVDGQEKMLKEIHDLISEADVIVTYNGIKFDMPTLNREFVVTGMSPPAPYKNVDLYRVVRSTFNFISNKLAYVSVALGLQGKTKHEGHELWVKCMNNDPDGWAKMEEYNRQDVVLTEQLYDKLRPWVKSHPNHNIYDEGDIQKCPNCASLDLKKRGYTYTNVSKFQRYRCEGCGAWSRGRANLKAPRKNVNVGNV